MDWALALEQSAPARLLRSAVSLYPAVDTAHVVGLALLFGAIVPLDLRLIGCWRSVPLATMARTALPVAVTGLLLTLASGTLLFIVRARDYAAEPLFVTKMVLLGFSVGNALWLHRGAPWRAGDVAHRPGWRVAGALSLCLWLAVIAAGRWIGYR